MLKKINELCEIGKSAVLYPIAFLVNQYRRRVFNFNVIARDTCSGNIIAKNGICIERSSDGRIIALHDGKRTPLVFGSIPHQENHIENLKKLSFKLTGTNGIEIFSLNLKSERDQEGLSTLVNSNNLTLFKYPTIDRTPISFIDLIRAVRDLEQRDTRNQGLAYVHCLMGAGRAPLTIAAYLAHIVIQVGIDINPDFILLYLKSRRPQVGLLNEQRMALHQFYFALKNAGNFNNFYALHKDAVERRDREIENL
jgi:protein-tyrosine phosphatase